MAAKSSPEQPLPLRSVLQMVAQWIGRLGTVWAEGQITELSARGGTVFLTLRDPVANVSARVMCPRAVYEATARSLRRTSSRRSSTIRSGSTLTR